MKILALGATGAIGGRLIETLGSQEHEICVTTRRARGPAGPVRYIQGNAQDDAFLGRLLEQDWDVIVDFMVYDTASFHRRVDALLGATGQYIFTSSARVFADSSVPLDERSPRLLDVSSDATFLATDEYALTKARQEDILHASGQGNWTIIRPYITFGEGRLQLGTLEKEGWLYRALHGRSIVFCDALVSKWTTMTDGGDVARMIAALVGNPGALGEDFNLTGSKAMTWGDVLSLYLDGIELHLGVRPKIVLQSLENFCRSSHSVPQVTYDRMYDRRFDPAKIGQLFDLSSLTDCLPTLKARLRAQLDSGNFLSPDWRAEGLRDRELGERAALREISGSKPKLRYLYYRYFPRGMARMTRGQ
ncbi:NAD-dependent epimerase/dehydratase family protein [Zavarzinia compransoris]|uniref:Epimerase n=1 Tax=Zavarzinia compransoris TaxID=1264899 RepID=A0A317E3H7_9PROT|nr:NAD-dependent epimerase/dehydratase family protein [Zavarzinia compransoris]PWR21539.1 epimerase [Zavarzinia compransoris]TDP45694.1 nucleoside-diphosphate-sugar epimerase [Zavarzinia compransoris]